MKETTSKKHKICGDKKLTEDEKIIEKVFIKKDIQDCMGDQLLKKLSKFWWQKKRTKAVDSVPWGGWIHVVNFWIKESFFFLDKFYSHPLKKKHFTNKKKYFT